MWNFLFNRVCVAVVLLLLGMGFHTSASANEVPDVGNLLNATAYQRLQSAGFRALQAYDQEHSTTVPACSVIHTQPAAHATAAAGSTVTMIVSAGPPSSSTVYACPVVPTTTAILRIPDVVGRQNYEGYNTLKAAGYDAYQQLVPSDTVPPCQIFATYPAPNTVVQQGGGRVIMTVSSGPPAPLGAGTVHYACPPVPNVPVQPDVLPHGPPVITVHPAPTNPQGGASPPPADCASVGQACVPQNIAGPHCCNSLCVFQICRTCTAHGAVCPAHSNQICCDSADDCVLDPGDGNIKCTLRDCPYGDTCPK